MATPYLVDKSIEGWMTDEELAWLSGAASQHEKVVEIGCWKGRSTLALMHCRRTLYCIDHWKGDGTSAHAEAAANPSAVRAAFDRTVSKVTSGSGVIILDADINDIRIHDFIRMYGVMDMVFIDGKHTDGQPARDIAFATSVLNRDRNSLICGHDYADPSWPEVTATVDRIFGDRVRRGPHSLWYIR